jgi:hypothetical protein
VSFVCVRGTICWAMRCEVSIVASTENILTGNELCFVQQLAAGVSCLHFVDWSGVICLCTGKPFVGL